MLPAEPDAVVDRGALGIGHGRIVPPRSGAPAAHVCRVSRDLEAVAHEHAPVRPTRRVAETSSPARETGAWSCVPVSAKASKPRRVRPDDEPACGLQGTTGRRSP
jgi:hypothetical protein